VNRPTEKYAVQERLWGRTAQEKIRAARVVVFGVGGTGSAHAEALARAGVGTLVLVDRDVVEYGDLHRNRLYDEEDARRATPKALAVAARLRAINADVSVEPIVAFADAANAVALAAAADALVDGSDNFALRWVLNDVAVATGRPLIYQGALGAVAAAMAVIPRAGPCLGCIAVDGGDERTCADVGVSPALVAAVGAWGATLTLATVRGDGANVAGWLYRFEDTGAIAAVRVGRDPSCERCGLGRFGAAEPSLPTTATRVCGGGAWEIWPAARRRLDLAAVASRLAADYGVAREGPTLQVEGEGLTGIFFEDGRALIYGAGDSAAARRWYERCVG